MTSMTKPLRCPVCSATGSDEMPSVCPVGHVTSPSDMLIGESDWLTGRRFSDLLGSVLPKVGTDIMSMKQSGASQDDLTAMVFAVGVRFVFQALAAVVATRDPAAFRTVMASGSVCMAVTSQAVRVKVKEADQNETCGPEEVDSVLEIVTDLVAPLIASVCPEALDDFDENAVAARPEDLN